MIFAISMDYTVFLLSSAPRSTGTARGDPKEAMVGGVAHSGRVIFAAAAVMVAVFFTFALSGPLPPKEMGVILGIAVLLDAALVRLLLVPVLLRLLGRGRGGCRSRWTACCPTCASGTRDADFLKKKGLPVPCLDGLERPYLSLDAAASTGALPAVAERVAEFLPYYSSVHRGAGYKSQLATARVRAAHARRSGASPGAPTRDDVAIICRNTTEVMNHLATDCGSSPTTSSS